MRRMNVFNIGILIVPLFALFSCHHENEDSTFVVRTFGTSIDLDSFSEVLQIPKSFHYEDADYTAWSSCNGEWGGTLFMKNKHSDETFRCESSCPLILNRIKEEYYLTSTLAHLEGLTSIIKISDPKRMEGFTQPEPIDTSEEGILIYSGEDFKTQSLKGTEDLLDSVVVGGLTISSFVKNDKLYHLLQTRKGVFLSRIDNGHFKFIDTVSNEWLYAFDSWPVQTGNSQIIIFKNRHRSGYIRITGEYIDVYLKP